MELSINIHSPVAVYVQIENQIRFAIATDRLKAGTQLPSVRELSEHLNINPNTVAKAYRDLEVMGLLYTRRGMGVFVNKGVQARCKKRCKEETIRRLHEVVQEAKASGMTKKELTSILDASYATDGQLYGEVPEEVLKLIQK